MKNQKALLSVLAAFTFGFMPQTASAEPGGQSAQTDGSSHLGLGLSTSSLGMMPTSFSGLLELGRGDWVQAFFGIGSISPFQFGVGGALKHELARRGSAGLHLGGGFGVGNATSASSLASGIASAFFTSATPVNSPFGAVISALGGIHLAIPGAEALVIHLDGGAILTIAGGANFQAQALSPALGISIFYMI